MMKIVLAVFLLTSIAFAVEKNPSAKVKYRKSKKIDFESLLIEGERKRPEMSVVTGNIGEKDSGLFRYRENFLDVMANDLGEEVQ